MNSPGVSWLRFGRYCSAPPSVAEAAEGMLWLCCWGGSPDNAQIQLSCIDYVVCLLHVEDGAVFPRDRSGWGVSTSELVCWPERL